MFLHVSVILSGGGAPGPDPGGEVGGLARGVSRPRPRGEVGGLAGGGGCPGPGLLRGVSQHALRLTTTPPQQTATATDGTHPTGMLSCLIKFEQQYYLIH